MAASSSNRVCVIGAGIAGLVTAKVLRNDGFDVTVFERNESPSASAAELSLPSAADMDDEIDRVGRWMAERFPARPEGYFVGPYISHYIDELLTDMGLRTNRTGTRVKELMAPLWPSRYRDVPEERRRVRGDSMGVRRSIGVSSPKETVSA